MKLRFFIAIAFTILAFTAMILLVGNCLALYFDPASFVAGILLPHVLIALIVRPSEQKKMIGEILSGKTGGDRVTLTRSIHFLQSLKKMIISCSLATAIVGIIAIMANLEDTASVGPNMAVCLIVAFYAALYILAVIEPLRLTAETKLAGSGE